MSSLDRLTDFLARDVALWGGLSSPMLSWLGSAGLVLFFLWQVGRLVVEAARARQPFVRLRPALTALAERVEATDLEQAYGRAVADGREPATALDGASCVVAVEQVRALDRVMRETGVFRRPWIQLRKTLLIEHVRWFKEPRVFSTRRAEEFFTQDAVLGSRIDLAFFAQVPSLITGLGLLLTFVAICIGLSRLHADGQTVTGIQGLINGLSGKFITSIVGLVCANLFVLVERPLVRGLLRRHAEFLALLDESFPRRTAEDLLDALARHHPSLVVAGRGEHEESGEGAPSETPELQTTIEGLAEAIRLLTERVQEPRDAVRTLTAALHSLEASQSRTHAQLGALLDRLGAAAGRGGSRAASRATDGDLPLDRRERWSWARTRSRSLG
jgi:hypothetical protein